MNSGILSWTVFTHCSIEIMIPSAFYFLPTSAPVIDGINGNNHKWKTPVVINVIDVNTSSQIVNSSCNNDVMNGVIKGSKWQNRKM